MGMRDLVDSTNFVDPAFDDIRGRVAQAAAALRSAGAREVYLFGSAARGTLCPGSDIDLAVKGLPPARFYEAMGQAADLIGRPIDLVDLDDNTPLTRYLIEENELIYVG